ncbi:MULTISPECIES: winged helix-turn-helix domain-containing protein [Ralstonia]|uniref:Phosphate regulon transcriptional regulatory protein phoB n=1 Tax=Ralstonia mannitolilytica TaxID=105219 RepID=A0AAJ4ZKE2_9RALS|nr:MULTISPECIES: winged helix-turn-helix domain-containing protein [Ralstonia]PLT19392.1 DNA-binding response regulator [Ralstonia mannitolilytica]QIF07710.1 DNA-binding response regulator [Ralstonia mannitolilytica]CAG2150368.1 Phosphate regulon transcriptional regulatory protein PhoB [Ralstonia mannitolilytica]CAJ0724477.1 Phosphate regulon transcriptional regulatory protein PhoB [Ralstonia mannitolilytica]CAJ0783679.1 Phosphate regulon transcriptional regulatory protein PhoB [Ralstonia mann
MNQAWAVRTLVVGTDRWWLDRVIAALREGGYSTTHVNDPTGAHAAVITAKADVVLLSLGAIDEEALRDLRSLRSNAHTARLPVIAAVRDATPAARISAFDAGADEVWSGQCHAGELHARIRALLRRSGWVATELESRMHSLQLHAMSHSVTAQTELGPRRIVLSPIAFRLLRFLVANPRRVHSREELLAQVWGNCLCIGKRTVDVHIRKLRMALEGTHSEGWVQTVRSGGYRFSPAEDLEPTDGATFEYTGREGEALTLGR